MLVRSRTSLERIGYATTERLADRLFGRTPAGLTVVRAVGMEAVAAVGYPLNRFQTQSLVVARGEGSLQVTTHLQYAACTAGCETSECVTAVFDKDKTVVITGHRDDPVEVATHLRAQNSAQTAIETMIAERGDSSHNPFASEAAAAQLGILADQHTQDAVLSMINRQL